MTKTVACLAGDGVGPELMAAATRTLDRVAALHNFELDDRHLPFAGEAVTRSGHALPAATRAGYREADAILVASPHEPAFAGVKADLQLVWRVARVARRRVPRPRRRRAGRRVGGRDRTHARLLVRGRAPRAHRVRR